MRRGRLWERPWRCCRRLCRQPRRRRRRWQALHAAWDAARKAAAAVAGINTATAAGGLKDKAAHEMEAAPNDTPTIPVPAESEI